MKLKIIYEDILTQFSNEKVMIESMRLREVHEIAALPLEKWFL
jgi:hypothetical protein